MDQEYIDFRDIAPFDDSEFHEKMSLLVKEPGFEHAVRYVMPDVDYQGFVAGLLDVKDKWQFQHDVMWPFLEMLAKKTTSGIDMSGAGLLEEGVHYTFITNHRDIVLDASFLNLMMLRNNLPTSEVAIGNNLLIFDWITDLVKLNKSFIVKRNLEIKQALSAAQHLSAYIHYAVGKKGESVWIAQREGRAKDSNDVTQDSLIKMLALAGGECVIGNLKQINLCPVSISYEYDPNDYLKAREFLLKRNDPEFKKSQRDDLFSMETGLLQFKGHVHFDVGGCINRELDSIDPGLEKAEAIRTVCEIIDRKIHSGYKIYPINYIAHDKLHGVNEYRHFYTDDDESAFEAYLDRQLDKVRGEVDFQPTADDLGYMREMMYRMYANPLKNKRLAGA